MNIRLTSIYIISIILLCIYMPSRSFKKPVSKKKYTTHHRKAYFSNSPKLSSLLYAYCIGEKSSLSPEDKDAHKNLNLYHLFTPSGLHFGSLFLFFNSLVFFLPKKVKKLSTSFILMQYIKSMSYPYALK